MPTYEYKCKKCQYRFEEFQNISEKPLSRCPQCGGRVHRLISGGAGFLFRGSGFYVTDYRSESYKKAEKADKGESKGETKEMKEKAESKKE
ncbi:MAG: zinc ribbon domain-containing protein [Gemmatimonadota bacterium]|nr:MAG: zinc ribbon domain-containing protein [Gemmatimonadota bacterium]